MTKKETDLFDGLVTLVKESMEVNKEILKTLRERQVINVEATPPITITPGNNETIDTEDTKTEVTPSPATPTPAPTIPKPKEYKIEDCRHILGVMVEKLGEDAAWAYLKTFKVEMLPDLDPSQYAELVKGAEEQLA